MSASMNPGQSVGDQQPGKQGIANDLPSLSFPRGWTLVASIIALLVCLPLVVVVILAFFPSENIWPHLLDSVLPGYVVTTLIVMLGVACGTASIGIATAWTVTHYEFPGRKLFAWALLLPFAVPAYVLAYVYTDMLEFAGPVQTQLRAIFGWSSARDYYFPSIRSTGGAIIVLVLVLYPYVYLLARAAFLEQSASLLEVAQVLGKSTRTRFFKVALPLARPAIVVGVSMALMETLNDYGTVSYFAVRTMTAGIYDVWLGMNNLGGGAQMATLLLMFVLLLFGLERASRQTQNVFQPPGGRLQGIKRHPLSGTAAMFAFLLCALPIVLGFLIPAWVLLRYAIAYFEISWTPEFQAAARHSLTLSALAAIITAIIGIVLSYALRLRPGRTLRKLVSVATIGYTVPGAVLAIGIIIPFGLLDNSVDAFFRQYFGISTGLLLSGSIFALLFAYSVRFLAAAYGAISTSLQSVNPSMDEVGRSFGYNPLTILARIHLPLIKGGLLTAMLVVFVDCMKELPATLIMRPFNYDTLATQVYQYASDELIEQSALGALLIVVVGLAPVILLSKSIDRSRGK